MAVGWSIELRSNSVPETFAIGRAVGACMAADDVVGLVGCLGAGKTHLTKGIACGLGVPDPRLVNSPTFVLVNEYEGRLHIFHVDAYRLSGVRELEAVGFDEICASGGVVLIEWADRIAEALERRTLWIELTVTGEAERGLSLRTDEPAVGQRMAGSGLDRWQSD